MGPSVSKKKKKRKCTFFYTLPFPSPSVGMVWCRVFKTGKCLVEEKGNTQP